MSSKIFVLGMLLAGATTAVAEGDGVWVDGVVTYNHPDGTLVNRDCDLFVPAMGQGEVKLACGDWSTTTSEFQTSRDPRDHGMVRFSVIFRDVPGAPSGLSALYTGAYLRGTNRAIYYGNVYSGTGSDLTTDLTHKWSYTGGFMFAADIVAGQ